MQLYNPAHMLKLRVLCRPLILLTAIYGFAGDTTAPDLLTATSRLVDIRSNGDKPFQLDADFTAQTNLKLEGHLIWKWSAKDLWSQEIRMGDYREVSIRNGDTLYVSRNAPFTPLRVTQLQGLLTVFSAEQNWKVRKLKHQTQNGIDAECAEISVRASRSTWKPKRTLCIDLSTKDPLTEETRDEDQYYLKEFSGYQAFREHSYPNQLKLSQNGSVVLKVKVNSLRDATFDDTSFAPPQGAIARRQCENVIPPKAVKTPDPIYPASAAQNGLGGLSIVALTVLPDGSADNVQLIGSAGHEMDQVTQQIVKTWKFKPAMCGNEPIAFDIRVEVTFRMQ